MSDSPDSTHKGTDSLRDGVGDFLLGSPSESFNSVGPISLRNTATSVDAANNPSEASCVKVMIRVRPFNSREISLEEQEKGTVNKIQPILSVKKNVLTIVDKDTLYAKEAFAFDEVLWSVGDLPRPGGPKPSVDDPSVVHATQSYVFEKVGMPMVAAAASGYNCSIMAYGQTGSGKTHSMLGGDTEESKGIAPRLVRKLFEHLKTVVESTNGAIRCSVHLSFLEIYNEKVKDLLASGVGNSSISSNDTTGYSECKVRYHHSTGTFVEGLVREEIHSEQQCQDLIKAGIDQRAVASTNMNSTSSRSHAVFQLCVRQRDDIRGSSKLSIINLVDLAGSERVRMSGAAGKTLVEAKNINQSLSTLRRVIDILIENASKGPNQRKAVPPHRESMLTWLLSDSLGGNSRTAMLATVSPHVANYEDTLNTLRYALKTKAIVCHVKVNETKSAVIVDAIKQEMENLKAKLALDGSAAGPESQLSDHAKRQLQAEIEDRDAELQAALEEQQRSEKHREQLKMKISEHEESLAKLREVMAPKLAIWKAAQAISEEMASVRRLKEVQQQQMTEEQALAREREQQLQFESKRRMSLIARTERTRKSAEVAAADVIHRQQMAWVSVFKTAIDADRTKAQISAFKTHRVALQQREQEGKAAAMLLTARCRKFSSEVHKLQSQCLELEKQNLALAKAIGDAVEERTSASKGLIAGKKAADEERHRCKAEMKQLEPEIEFLEDKLSPSDLRKCSSTLGRAETGFVEVASYEAKLEVDIEEIEKDLRQRCVALHLLQVQSEEREQEVADVESEANGLQAAEDTLILEVSQLEAELESIHAQCAELDAEEAQRDQAEQAIKNASERFHRESVRLQFYVYDKLHPEESNPAEPVKPPPTVANKAQPRIRAPSASTPNRRRLLASQ